MTPYRIAVTGAVLCTAAVIGDILADDWSWFTWWCLIMACVGALAASETRPRQ